MHPDRINALASDVWASVFHALDCEPDCDWKAAGQVATQVEEAFRAAVTKNVEHSDGTA